MLAYWDTDERCRFATRAYEQAFGVAPEGIVGKHLRELLGPSYEHDAPYVEAVLRGEQQEVEHGTPDRSRGTGHDRRTRYVPDIVDGTVRGFFVTISDISEPDRADLVVAVSDTERMRVDADQRVLAEAGIALEASLDYRQTLQQLATLVTRHGLGDLCVIDMLGSDGAIDRLTVVHTDATMAGARARLAAMPIERGHLLAASALATRAPQLISIPKELSGSSTRTAEHFDVLRELGLCSAIAIPLMTPTQLLGALVIASAEPERYTERDLPITTELARRAALAIESAQLYETARHAAEARDEVLGIVVHDVRAPLNAITLTLKLLERRPSVARDPVALAAVEMATESIARANRLISDLLDVRLIEGGALAVQCAIVTVEAILGDAMRSSRLAAVAASQELVCMTAASLPSVRVDRDRILQVLENLIGNAIKFSPAGGRILVEAEVAADGVVISVRDTGPGIAAENLARVFGRFWRAGRARRDGAGLGLSICRGIIDAHGGRIWVESEPGLGSSFRFSIPVA